MFRAFRAPIWIGGVPGSPRPVIAAGGQAFHLVRPRYLVVHDLEVRGASANGINTDDEAQYANADAARFVVFRNLFIHDVGTGGNQDCLKLSGLNDFWVLDSEFQRCGGAGSGSAIDHVGCHHPSIDTGRGANWALQMRPVFGQPGVCLVDGAVAPHRKDETSC